MDRLNGMNNMNNTSDANDGLNNDPKFTSDPLSSIHKTKNAEAFLQMANELQETEEYLVEDTPDQPNKKRPLHEPKVDLSEITDKQRVRSVVAGPKFMDALSDVIEKADIRSLEVELPMLGTTVEVSPLTGEEEIALKTAAVSTSTFLSKIDEIIYRHTTFKDIEFNNYEDFLENLYPPDKSMLIWALMTTSYLTLPSLETVCGSCGERYLIEKSPADMFHDDTLTKGWDKSADIGAYFETQSVLDGYIKFEIGMPSEKTRLIVSRMVYPEDAKENSSKRNNIFSYMDNLLFFTRSIIVGDKDPIILTDLIQDLYPFLHKLPPKISDGVKNGIDVSIYDEYMPNFYLNCECSHCKAHEELTVEPEITFFRKALSL